MKASRLSYLVRLMIVKKPILHSLPRRYDLVRFTDSDNRRHTGVVIGLPNEEVQVVGGVVIVNGVPDLGEAPGGIILTGDCELTRVEGYSILVATLKLGRIEQVYHVSFASLIGKVGKLF